MTDGTRVNSGTSTAGFWRGKCLHTQKDVSIVSIFFTFLQTMIKKKKQKTKNTASIGVLSLESTLVEPTRY